jgi:hypothetical protein
MYWLWTGAFPGMLIWCLLMLGIVVGGWLIVSLVFDLDQHERVLVGLAVGLVSFLWLANWLGRWLLPYWTFVISGALVLFSGLLLRFASPGAQLDRRDWNIPAWLLTGFVLGWMFLRVSMGTGMFDEYKNLALISTLANGNIPALAYTGSPELLRYHYGFHLLGAGMMQVGHFMPWSAFDLSKAIVWSLSILLAGLVGRRFLKSSYGPLLAGASMALAGGTRYLLLLLPSGLLHQIDSVVKIANSSVDTSGSLAGALASNWVVDSGPPVGYPFAFLSGVNPPYVIAHGGETTITLMLFMLALLLVARGRDRSSAIVYIIVFSYWALAAEASLVLFAAGWLLGLGRGLLRNRQTTQIQPGINLVSVALLGSAPLTLLQGGTISAMAQRFVYTAILRDQTVFASASVQQGIAGFSLQWPPGIISSHLGFLPVTNLLSLLVAILEIGPVILFLPWLIYDWYNHKREDWLTTLLVSIAGFGLLVSLLVSWQVERDITRITDFAVAPVLLLVLLALDTMQASGTSESHKLIFWPAAISIGLMCVSGIILGGVQLTAGQRILLSQHYDDKEVILLKEVWGRLPRGAKMFGQVGKPNILTGQLTGGIYNYAPGDQRILWDTLETSPTLSLLISNGFDFVFVDSAWWRQISPASRQELENGCISIFAETVPGTFGQFLRILDLRNCH